MPVAVTSVEIAATIFVNAPTPIVGSGYFECEPSTFWGFFSQRINLVDSTAICLLGKEIFVLLVGQHSVLVLALKDGFRYGSGREADLERRHEVLRGLGGSLYITSEEEDTVRRSSPDSQLSPIVSEAGRSKSAHLHEPFNRRMPALPLSLGEIHALDGYGCAFVRKFSVEDRNLLSCDESVIDPGQFNIPRNICYDRKGVGYVADRERRCARLFALYKRYRMQWAHRARPCGPLVNETDHEPPFCIAEFAPTKFTSTARGARSRSPRYDCNTQGRDRGASRNRASRRRAGLVHRAARPRHGCGAAISNWRSALNFRHPAARRAGKS